MSEQALDERTADLQTSYNICRWLVQNRKLLSPAEKKRIELHLATVQVELCLAQSRLGYRQQMEV